jgi:hypothetical protein
MLSQIPDPLLEKRETNSTQSSTKNLPTQDAKQLKKKQAKILNNGTNRVSKEPVNLKAALLTDSKYSTSPDVLLISKAEFSVISRICVRVHQKSLNASEKRIARNQFTDQKTNASARISRTDNQGAE